MASRKELQRLEDENRTLCQRLTDTEVELSRKQDELKAASVRLVRRASILQAALHSKSTLFRKVEMLNDLREYQRRLKETQCQLEKKELEEQVAQARAHEAGQRLEKLEGSQRDQAASNKITVSNLQLEIKSLSNK